MVFRGMKAPPPSRQQLQYWERVCRYLDAQPYRSVAVPLPIDPPMTVRLLKRMARFHLVKHRDDCTWRLSKEWQAILNRLRSGLPGDAPSRPGEDDEMPQPFVVDAGIDTLYVNLLGDDLPLGLLHACEAFKTLAQSQDDTVETPWRLFDAPLSMWKAGKGSSGKGRGTSWGYILRNEWVELRLRKTAVSGIIGRVHFLAKALWVHGPRAALDAVAVLEEELWHWNYAPFINERADGDDPVALPIWRTSEIHLCADVAHFVLQPVDLERVVTRSIRQTVHILPDGTDGASWEDDPDDFNVWDEPDADPFPMELLDMDEWAEEAEDEDEEADDGEGEGDAEEEEDEGLAQDEGAEVHLWAKRVSGFSFSPGGDLMVVLYDKALQERQWDLDWMRAIHAAGGWDSKASLTRVEPRFRRPTLRVLRAAFGEQEREWIDDPRQIIDHQQDLWAYAFGMPPEADIPDVIYRGWMRLAERTADENRGRWPTDPVWHTIQRAHFSDVAPMPLASHRERKPNLLQLDAEVYGLLKLRAVLRGAQLDGTLTLAQELGAFYRTIAEREDHKADRFSDEVREKARMAGKPLPLLPAGMLPLHVTRKGRGS